MKETKELRLFYKLPSSVRLMISLSIGFITYLVSRKNATAAAQFSLTWIGFSLTTLTLLWFTIATAKPGEIKMIAKKQDSSRPLISLFVLFASFVSLFAIIILLKALPEPHKNGYYLHIALSVLSVTLSWILIHTVFTLHYAHLYYSCKGEEKGIQKEHVGGLDFPGDEQPDYLDFAYFSFVVGMTFQVSDVQITSSHIRRLVLLHGILSFVYNTVIVALSINIISGLFQK